MTIVVTICKLFFAMAIGFYLFKRKVLNEDINKRLSTIILDITSPALILSSAATVGEGSEDEVLLLLVTGIAAYAILVTGSVLVAKVLRVPKDCVGVYRCMIIFANTSFMGYPVVSALYGNNAIFYTTIFHFGFNVLFYTYATYIMAKDAGQVSKFEPKRLLNSGVIAAVLAVVIYFAKIPMPDVILEPLSFVGNVTMPLSMIIIGSNMASYALGDVFKEKRMYFLAIIRLVIVPTLAFIIMRCITDDPISIGVVTTTLGMPVAAMVAMGSSSYEKQGKIGSISVILTTLCSIVTIPLNAMIVQFLLK